MHQLQTTTQAKLNPWLPAMNHFAVCCAGSAQVNSIDKSIINMYRMIDRLMKWLD